MRINALHSLSPAEIPVSQVVDYLYCLLIACIGVSVHKSHDGLVHNILRRPDVLSLCKLIEVFFGDRAYPFAAVELLAACKLGDYLVKLYFQLCVMVICHIVGSSGEPVTQEMTSQLAGGSFPAPVEICLCWVIHYLQTGNNYSCLKVEILEQAL